MEHSNSEYTDVVIYKGRDPKECVLNGIDKLGGISNFIKDDDQVFIKFNLSLPQGFPSHTNMDTLGAIIGSCLKAGAKKIYVGSFPIKGMTIKSISDLLGLKRFFLKIGAELVFLDNSDYYYQKNIDVKHLKIIKNRNFSIVKVNGKEITFPKIILESDKYISVNQLSVDPIFKVRLSILNSYSATTYKYQENLVRTNSLKEFASLVSDLYSLKKPDLVINDIFYILEGAGPHIYRDSNFKKTGLMVLGTDTIAVDMITLKLINANNILYEEAVNRNLGIHDISRINIIGENPDNIKISVKECVSKLEDINVPNFHIKAGKMFLGEFEQAYHLLNLLKSYMIKDIKYLSKTSFLIGINPPEPEILNNIILFGDNAIKSTKLKKNMRFLKLTGNPPNFLECIGSLVKFFGKGIVPTSNFFQKVNKAYMNQRTKRQLKIWEAL